MPAENRSLAATKEISRLAKAMFGELKTYIIRDCERGTGVDVPKVCVKD